jgi:hypothetical protein
MKTLLYFGWFFVASWWVAAAQSTYHSSQFFLEALSDHQGTVMVPVSDDESLILFKENLQTIAADDPDVERPSIVKLQVNVASGGVSIIPTAFFGEYDRFDPSMSNMRPEVLSNHFVKLHEVLSFPELERLGVKLNYRLVPAQPDHPYRPRLVSRAPSLTFEFVEIDRNMGRITIHNHSNKAVIALDMSQGGSPIARPGRTLIAPGANYEFDSDAPFCIKDVCGAEPPPLILLAAVFEDGSHEGDQLRAMSRAADWFGHSAEWKRIVSVMTPIMSIPNLDESEKINSLASAVHEVPADPDGDTVARFRMYFSELPADEIERGESLLAMDMRSERDEVENNLRWTREELDHKANLMGAVAVWWAHYAGK